MVKVDSPDFGLPYIPYLSVVQWESCESVWGK